MTNKIRIDDLAKPRLTPAQQAALAYGESQSVDLSMDAVLAAAVRASQLDDFGPDDFRERLNLWLSEMDNDDERTGLGRLSMFGDCVTHAVNRLRIQDLLKRHPEIRDVPIERPVIVVGLPRSGTTHLVNLIAADERFRSMPLWESREPVPDLRETVPPDGVDPRWERCNQAWEAARRTLPLLASMHPMDPDHVHEELALELPDFSSYHIEWAARCPGWRDYYLSHDQTPHYAYLRTVLQILQWQRPRERWVLKSPQHLEQLGPLMTTFPDATVVVTHRDPVSVIQSTATMMTYSARLHYRHTRPDWYVEYWADRIRRLLDSAVRDRDLLPVDRTVDVPFHDFMADEMGTVERIYDAAGLELTPKARAQVVTYRDDHPRGRDGQVVYDLRADFAVGPKEVRAPFRSYIERFGVREEVR
ncbi:sulfotransferase family protein [Actinomadura sp. 6N118]|uniref:sulfotransferase family protein n=1 Tax=Actinomadura sp. 6N118 TaxID=3375151 RepID=UPI003797C2DC